MTLALIVMSPQEANSTVRSGVAWCRLTVFLSDVAEGTDQVAVAAAIDCGIARIRLMCDPPPQLRA
jgi:hypothetical protein